MSPQGPPAAGIPPPAKRHQAGPPGQIDSPYTSQPRPQTQSSLPAPVQSTPQHNTQPTPHYSFYGGAQPHYSTVPYHPSPSYSITPNSLPPSHSAPPPRPSLNSNDTQSFSSVNGRPASPASRLSYAPPPPQASNPPLLPPRQLSSSYDTKPPPPTSSGFATINAPPASGFSAINSRNVGTPQSSHSVPTRPVDTGSATKQDLSSAYNRSYTIDGTPTSAAPTPASTASKRTPSTTHPYQMSEAFANRHHHCERVDSLNRGIWTSYGREGSRDNPTGPATEMYLRCNHDNCNRIDWRTVHGLQCHIVKNHDQPKGTIGSLEKALDKYGVPVKEVEEYERERGEGSAGTMADPKNLKIKNKMAGKGAGRKGTPTTFAVDETMRPAGWRPPNAAFPFDSPGIISAMGRSPSSGSRPSAYQQEEGIDSDDEDESPPTEAGRERLSKPVTDRFNASISEVWSMRQTQTPGKAGNETARDGDTVMRNAPPRPPSPLRTTQFHAHYMPSSRPTTSSASQALESPQLAINHILTRTEPVAASHGTPPSPPEAAREVRIEESPNVAGPGTSAQGQRVDGHTPEKDNQAPAPASTTDSAPTPMPKATEDIDQQMVDAPMAEVPASTEESSFEQPKEAKIEDVKERVEEPKKESSADTIRPQDAKEAHVEENLVTKESEPESEPQTQPQPQPEVESKTEDMKEKEVPKPDVQSPVVSAKSLSISSKRSSRRSSMAAKAASLDGDGAVDTSKAAAATRALIEAENEKDDDGDSITVANTRKERKDKELELGTRTPPRRMANGRFLRKGRHQS